MPKAGYDSLLVRDEVYERAKSHYRKKVKSGQVPEKKSFSRYVNDLIEEVVESDRIFSSSSPVLKKLAVEGNSIMIKDSNLDRLVEVNIQPAKDGREFELLCMTDKKKDCVHVGFAYSIPEVYRTFYGKQSS